MPEPKKSTPQHQPHGGRDKDTAHDRPRKRIDSTAGGSRAQDVDAAAVEQADTFQPDKNGTGW